MYGGLQEEAVGDQVALSTSRHPRELPREEAPVRASTRALQDAPAVAPGQLVLWLSHTLSTRRSSGRSHSLSPRGALAWPGWPPGLPPSCGPWTFLSGHRCAPIPIRAAAGEGLLGTLRSCCSKTAQPRASGSFHLLPRDGSTEQRAGLPGPALPVGSLHTLLLPSSTQAPPHMTPSHPLCVRPCPWGRDAQHAVGVGGWTGPSGWSSGLWRRFRASPVPTPAPRVGRDPFLERLFRARGCGMEPLLPAWAPPCSGEELPPRPCRLSEPQVKQRSESRSPWSGSGLCSAAGGSQTRQDHGGRAPPECGQGFPRGSEKANQSQPEGQKVRGSSPPGFPFHLGLRHTSL